MAGRVALVAHGQDWRRQEGLSLVLMTTSADRNYADHRFSDGEIVLFGRESAGVPQSVHDAADARLLIPVQSGLRSLNVAVSVAMVAGEALRQMGAFPKP